MTEDQIHQTNHTPLPSGGVGGGSQANHTPLPSGGVGGGFQANQSPLPSVGVGAQTNHTPLPSGGAGGGFRDSLRIVFMGTPEFAVATLKMLVEQRYNVVAVVTQPDKPVGRHGSVLQPSAVKQYALAQGLPVLQPEKMKDPEFIAQLRSYRANLQVVVAFRMLPEVVWAMPEYGTFNVHAALLPQYRGAAPINWAIINGEKQTGVTTFFLDHNIDTGRIIMQLPFDIPETADVEYVYDGLMQLGAEICRQTLERIVEAGGHPESMPQDECATLHTAPKIFKETCEINWEQPARNVYNFVRGLSPVPGAWTRLVGPDGKETVLKVFRSQPADLAVGSQPVGSLFLSGKQRLCVVCGGQSAIELTDVQLAGKKRMAVRDFLNGMKDIECYRVK